MSEDAQFAAAIVDALCKAKILGVRAGAEHRFTGVWPVVVEGRLFVRSWNHKQNGWFRAFKDEADGTIQLAQQEIAVHAKIVRSARLRTAVTVEFGKKYDTRGSKKWVEGFAEPARELTTLEFVPR